MPLTDTQHYDLRLLRQHVVLPPSGKVLELGYYDPAGALWAAGRAGHVVALRPTVDLVSGLEKAAREAGLDSLEVRLGVSPGPGERGTFDVALLLTPYFQGN